MSTHRIALAALGAEGALVGVVLAVVGALLQVDEVGVRVRLEVLSPVEQHPPAAPLPLLDLVRVVKLFLEDLSDLEDETREEMRM